MEIEKVHSCNQFSELFAKNQCKKTISEYVDLTKFYDKIEIEKPIAGFIPDILLSSSNGKQTLFVEIAVTHQCDENKINSKNKIIEFKIKSEEDLNFLKKHTIDTKLSNIRTYNFRETEVSNICAGECEKEVNVFVVYQNKECNFELVKVREVKDFLSNEKITYYELDAMPDYNQERARDKIRKVYFKGIHISHCYLCRHHVQSHEWGEWGEEDTFCKSLAKEVPLDEAINCRDYKTFSNMIDYKNADKDGVLFLENKCRKEQPTIEDWLMIEKIKKEEELIKIDKVIKSFNEMYLQQLEERKKKT